ncbi:MAG TPA: GNAT family N-acetyltransferase [Bacteroidia bacterium]|nr:GNAT family N-acetyltransferase [Bacteroidia bacterium]HNT80342.1 GNAT family N-acetyltransferase [Bacteroidia bacterium]
MFTVIQIENHSELLEDAFSIRRIVFVDEQKVSREEEFDNLDDVSNQYLVRDNDESIGTARWRQTEKGIKLERFAVLLPYRNKGAGDAILKRILADVIPLEQVIYLHAQEAAVRFYQRNGFSIVGDRFFEANIPHFKMIYAHS